VAGRLDIIYVADPAHPVGVGFYHPPTAGSRSILRDVAVSGDYVYLADLNAGLLILRFLSPVSVFTVPVSGGSFTPSVDGTSYIFPAGAFTDTVTITYVPLFPEDAPSPGDLVGIHHFFRVTAVYSGTGQMAQPAPGQTYTLTVQYIDAERGPAIEETLALYYWDGNRWMKETTSILDTEANIVTAQPDHFSIWAVLGETRRVYMPLVFRRY
jgi:hypothetical protein